MLNISQLFCRSQITSTPPNNTSPRSPLRSTVTSPQVRALISSLHSSQSSSGKHVVIFTSRKLHSSPQHISFHKQISDSLTVIVSHLAVKPSFLIAKGGITSNDVASIGLNISSAVVLGQIDVGVPVWRTGEESRFPGCLSPHYSFVV
jgi:uncharacterized protein YgbK (DUF1537 family)